MDTALSLPERFARSLLGLLCAGGREPRAMARSALWEETMCSSGM
jgi:hypothetical protein